MASKLSNGSVSTTVVWSCACLAVAAAVGAIVALVDARLVAIFVVGLPIAIVSIVLYRRYARQEAPVVAMLGTALVACASVTSTFNGIRVLRSATFADVLLVAGALVLIGALLSDRYTWPTYPLVGAIGAILLGISVAASTAISHTPDQDLLSGLLFLVGSVLTPLVVAAAARSPVALELIAFLWVTSGAVNGAVAVLDGVGITTLAPTLTGLSFSGRLAGLTVHPNHLGLACVMVVPVGFAMLLFERRFPLRVVWAALTALALVGVLESGSRGATLGIVVGPAVTAFLVSKRRLRTLAITAVLIAALGTIGSFTAQDLTSVARLTGLVAVQGADAERIGAVTQSLNDLIASPIIGNGYGYGRDAHNIYVQTAAAGGALGLTGFLLLIGSIVQSGIRSTFTRDLPFRLQVLAAALVGSLVTWLAVGIVENSIYDRYLYWPAGLLLAVRFLASTAAHSQRDTIDLNPRADDPPARGDDGLQNTTQRLHPGG